MKKNEALARLASIEAETQELRKIIEQPEQKFTLDMLQSFEDACKLDGVKPSDILPYSNPNSDFQENINAYTKLIQITKVACQGWNSDWNNSNEYKYYPYFTMGRSGFGFYGTYCGWADTFTGLGSRLCFPTREMAETIGRRFESIYKTFLTIK
jgi:hypothetical protein